MRQKFLDEHFHKEDEVCFFVAGSGLFSLHANGKVYEIRCEQGDLIGVPDGGRTLKPSHAPVAYRAMMLSASSQSKTLEREWEVKLSLYTNARNKA